MPTWTKEEVKANLDRLVDQITLEQHTATLSLRTKVWFLVACLIAAAILFPGLNSHQLNHDEVVYRVYSEDILNGGSLLQPRSPDGAPYYQKPPLYFWLSATTAASLGGAEWLPYRLWSALFGFGSIIATFILGRRLFGEDIGLLGAVLLATNGYFVNRHGAMSGVMDTAVVFSTLVSVLLVTSEMPRRSPVLCAVLMAIACGLAGWLKPLIGFFPFAITVLAALPYPRDRRRQILRVLVLSLPGVILINVAWPLITWWQAGDPFVRSFFQENINRMAGAEEFSLSFRPWYGQLRNLSRSSIPFATGVVATAILFYLFCVTRRWQLGVITLPAVAGMAALSLVPVRLPHYAYPIYPFVALAISVTFVAAVEWLLRPAFRTYAIVLAALGAVGVYQYALNDTEPSWSPLRPLGQQIAQGRVPLLSLNFEVPSAPDRLAIGTAGLFWGDWWRISKHAQSIVPVTAATVESFLNDDCPAVLIVPVTHPLSDRLKENAGQWNVVRFRLPGELALYGMNLDEEIGTARCSNLLAVTQS